MLAPGAVPPTDLLNVIDGAAAPSNTGFPDESLAVRVIVIPSPGAYESLSNEITSVETDPPTVTSTVVVRNVVPSPAGSTTLIVNVDFPPEAAEGEVENAQL